MQFQEENDLWRVIQNETNPITLRRRMMEMAKLLIEKAAIEPAEITLYDTDDLTDLFLEYQEAGNDIVEFFKKAIPHLDPEYQGQPFEVQLKQLQEQIAHVVSECARMIGQVKQLQEEHLRLNAEITALEKQKSEADRLENHLVQLKDYHTTLIPTIERLKNLHGSSQELYAEIQQGFVETIQKMTELLRESYTLHKNHLAENQKISDAFVKVENLPDISAAIAEVHQVNHNVNQQLTRFDELLGVMIRILETHLQNTRSKLQL